MKLKLLSVLMLSVLLSACGSDGGSSGTPSSSAAGSGSSAGSGGTGTGTTTTAGSDSGDCFTNAALYTTGNNYQIDVQNLDGSGSVATATSNRYTVNGSTTFKGNTATELQVDTTITTGIGAGSTTQVKNYTRLESSEAVTFGQISLVSTLGVSVSTTTSIDPALRKPYTLPLNTPRSYTYTVKFEGPAASPDKTQTLKETFLGTETISVPAGSFKACKMSSETTMDGITTKSTSWSVAEGPYRGLFLQSADGNGTITARTTLLRFNGV
ncbi:hypothetical protein [Zoogloea dura]|uniref:Lipoprotein n=1 Tax=Zoogloea dura TaxID=2728840 RepID=A0A848G6G2_9RHOO|nr:hypothetical protein [Zoogloea dura]NML26506.1 hypothetical protein [Zoogloea dura]